MAKIIGAIQTGGWGGNMHRSRSVSTNACRFQPPTGSISRGILSLSDMRTTDTFCEGGDVVSDGRAETIPPSERRWDHTPCLDHCGANKERVPPSPRGPHKGSPAFPSCCFN